MPLSEGLLIVATILLVVVAVSIVAARIGIAAPLLLVVLGMGVGYLPGVPVIEIPPELILAVVLPPLLYGAAVNVPVVELRRNLGPVAGLSVGLVVLSAVVVGVLLHLAFPELPLAAGIALGAVVAPTDAVAATAIGKRLGMPPRLVSILEGESLVNDATSLTLLRAAIAATAGTFVFWQAAALFAYAVAAATLVGLAVGILTVWVRARLQNPVYDTVVSFTVPFLAFVPAESLGASGVIAVVAAGLYSGHAGAKHLTASARITERLNWRTAQFILEHGVFLLMGFELHGLIDEVGAGTISIERTALLTAGIVLVLLVLRMAFVAPFVVALRRSIATHRRRAAGTKRLANAARHDARGPEATATQQLRLQRAEHRAKRRAADLAHAREQGLGWRGGFIVGWSGMRGVVTLAAAQSIPNEVPFRSQIVLIAFLVAVATLLLHGLTLPAVIRRLRPHGPSVSTRRDELISLYTDLSRAGSDGLDAALALARDRAAEERSPATSAVPATSALSAAHPAPSDRVIERVRAGVHDAIAPLAFALPAAAVANAPESRDAIAYLHLARAVLDAQRAALLEERAIGRYSSEALRAAEHALDAYEVRLTPPTAH